MPEVKMGTVLAVVIGIALWEVVGRSLVASILPR